MVYGRPMPGLTVCASWSPLTPPKVLRGGISKVNLQQTLSIFGDKYPQNGSKNAPRAPRTSLGCPHLGPSVIYYGAGANNLGHKPQPFPRFSRSDFIPQEVLIKSFCKSQFPHKSVNLVRITDKVTDLRGNRLFANYF